MSKAILFLTFLFSLCIAQAQTGPKRELRGAWIATYANIDWPNRTHTPAQQQEEFIRILENHQSIGINAVYVQVRSQCDAFYPSAIDPWSADLTGVQGKNPGWDPLQFMIEESHKRGMELHAWINPYRAIDNYARISSLAPGHVARKHPEWLLATGKLRTLNPGIPAVREYILDVITDIVDRYDVDGVHFDDYFYPIGTFNDDAAFAADPRGFINRADWRRDNVNLLVQEVSETIYDLKPWVKFGISPSGIYRNSPDPEIGSPTYGMEHYSQLYSDTRKWLEEGWVDYISPQLYWYIGQRSANYGALVPWWDQNAFSRHIYIGMASYKVGERAEGSPWMSPDQFPAQLRMNRDTLFRNIRGQAFYNTRSLLSNRLGLRDTLRRFFQRPALQPTMPWLDSVPPAAPSALAVVPRGDNSIILKWNKPPAAADELDRVRQYVVYRSESPDFDLNDPANILAITATDVPVFTDREVEQGKTYYYRVTALDRLHNESTPSNTDANTLLLTQKPSDQEIPFNGSTTVALPDFRSLAGFNKTADVIQYPAPGTLLNKPGVHTVSLLATDAAGNRVSCSFAVHAKAGTAQTYNGGAASGPEGTSGSR